MSGGGKIIFRGGLAPCPRDGAQDH